MKKFSEKFVNFLNGNFINKTIYILMSVGIVAISALLPFWVYFSEMWSDSEIRTVIVFVLFSILLITLFLLQRVFLKYELRNSENLEFREYLQKELDNPNLDANKDVFALMLKNNDETTGYFSLSKKQASIAYAASIITSILGILLLFVSLILFVLQRIDTAIIFTISGAVTEVISGTVLWIYNKSAMQLNHYYNALHENERFLSAVNLVSKLSENLQDMMYIEIIRSQLPPAKELQTEQKLEVKKK